MVFCFILFFLHLDKIKGFFIISLEIVSVDDCIKRIKLGGNILYVRNIPDTNCDIHEHYFEGIHYEIGQKLNIEVLDVGGSCFL